MKAISLLYHDVIEGDDLEASGLSGPGAALYKLGKAAFAAHLNALATSAGSPTDVMALVAGAGEAATRPPWLLTFDDGGSSASDPVAGLLADRGWIGHFFITGDRIGGRGFVDADGIRALATAGHVIGSHSWSHPPRMSSLAGPALLEEWRRSVDRLSDILGYMVKVASVPGGFHSTRVARAAAEAGIEVLFTSEPVVGGRIVEGCLVLGRFTLKRGATAEEAVALAAGLRRERIRQWLGWNLRKSLKRMGGPVYDRTRETLLRLRSSRGDG